MLLNRLKKNAKRLKGYLSGEKTNCYRLYDRDMPEYPFCLDVYDDYVMVFERGRDDVDEDQREVSHQLIQEALTELGFEKQKLVFKTRKQDKGGSKYQKSHNAKRLFEVKEGQASFLINPFNYIDVGLFLDHRPIRKILFKQACDKKLLNLFSYTCSVGVQFALGGGETTNVDLSNTYLEWGKENYQLNHIELNKHRFIKQDVMKYVESSKEKFDVIMLDPPTFSNSKSMKDNSFDVVRDHPELVKNCMKLLSSDGILLFSNNKRKFKLSEELYSFYNIKDISKKTIPPDFRDPHIHVCYEISLKSN